MNNIQHEPMVKHSNQVHTTTDYFLFKPIEGNRNKNLLHINRLKKSIEDNYLFTVIIVNENYEIIDGQHRFEVISELGLPLNYIVCNGYGLNEVHVLNQNSKTWTSDDYLDGYCKLGYKDYLKYKEFKDTYDLSHNICLSILSGTGTNPNTSSIKDFYMGLFKVNDFNTSCAIAEKLNIVATYYDGWKRNGFVFSMLKLFNNTNFEFTEFIQKLKLQPTALTDCVTIAQYIALIEEIYNYRRRDKVNLRY